MVCIGIQHVFEKNARWHKQESEYVGWSIRNMKSLQKSVNQIYSLAPSSSCDKEKHINLFQYDVVILHIRAIFSRKTFK